MADGSQWLALFKEMLGERNTILVGPCFIRIQNTTRKQKHIIIFRIRIFNIYIYRQFNAPMIMIPGFYFILLWRNDVYSSARLFQRIHRTGELYLLKSIFCKNG